MVVFCKPGDQLFPLSSLSMVILPDGNFANHAKAFEPWLQPEEFGGTNLLLLEQWLGKV